MSTFWPLEAIAPGLNRKRQKLRFSFTKGSCTKRGLILSQFDNIGPKLVIFQRFIVFEKSFEMSYYCINKIIDVPHCSKSSFFVQKINFNFPRKLSIFYFGENSWKFTRKTPTFFFTKFFLTIFLVKSKLSTAKKSKTTTFSRVFHPKKQIDNFLGKLKLNFWTKNEDFEQCGTSIILLMQ